MKRNLMVSLAVILVAIVVIAAAAYISFRAQKDKNNTLEVGDFLMYGYIYQASKNEIYTGNMTCEILGLNDSDIYYKIVESGVPTYYNETKNTTVFAMDPTHTPSGWGAFIFVDTETLDTKWGALSVDHYIESGNISQDYWLRNGVMMKSVRISGQDISWTCFLLDTNMPQVID